MRRRWQINMDVLFAVAFIWFWVGFGLALISKPDGGHSPAIWGIAAWLGPYVVIIVWFALRGAWRWVRDGGYVVKRVYEPIREDLRERAR